MPRLSIDITPEQHQKLKAIAALSGKTIKEYVLERALPDIPVSPELSEEEALAELTALLKPRIEAAEQGDFSKRTFAEIAQKAFEDVQH